MIRPFRFACFLLCTAFAMLAFASGSSWAQGAKSLGKFGDWAGFTYADHGAKVCYAASVLKSSDKGPKKRGLAIITLTDRAGDKSNGIISIEPGLILKKGVAPALSIGATKFELYVQGKSVWTKDDKAVVAALLKGKIVQFHGMPETGAAFIDTYSLTGFDKARAAIDAACGVK